MGQQSEWILARMIWYCPTDSYQKIFGSFPAVVDILLGIPVWYCGTSAICLDLPSVESFEKIRKIMVVPVCHRCTPAIGYFIKSRLLAIIGSPWFMTLAPTNEAIRHETSNKNLIPQGKKLTNLLGCHIIGVRIDFYQEA